MVKKIVGVGILSATLLFGITGCDIKVGKMDYEEYKRGMYAAETEIHSIPEANMVTEKHGKDIKKLDISLDMGIVAVTKSDSDEFKVSVGKNQGIVTKNEGGILKIANEGNAIRLENGVHIGEERMIEVKVPSNSNIDMAINLGAGLVSIKDVGAKTIDVANGLGMVGTPEVIKANKINVKQGAGMISFAVKEGKDITTKQELGMNMIIAEKLTGNVNQESKMGAVVTNYIEGNPNVKTDLMFGETMLPETSEEFGANRVGNVDLKNNLGLVQVESITKEELIRILKEASLEGELDNINNEVFSIDDEGFEINIG